MKYLAILPLLLACRSDSKISVEPDDIVPQNADIDGDALGYTVMIFAFVGLTSQAETDLQDFEKMVGDWDMVRECHMLMGETDFLLKIVAYDWDDFQRFLTTKLTPAPNVSHVKTALSIRSRKIKPGVPVLSEA